jgi:hypothetical protein
MELEEVRTNLTDYTIRNYCLYVSRITSSGLFRIRIYEGLTHCKASTCTTQCEHTPNASSDIQTQDPSVRAGQDNKRLRPRGHWDRHIPRSWGDYCVVGHKGYATELTLAVAHVLRVLRMRR